MVVVSSTHSVSQGGQRDRCRFRMGGLWKQETFVCVGVPLRNDTGDTLNKTFDYFPRTKIVTMGTQKLDTFFKAASESGIGPTGKRSYLMLACASLANSSPCTHIFTPTPPRRFHAYKRTGGGGQFLANPIYTRYLPS